MTKLTNRQAIVVLDGLWSNPLFGEAHRQAFEIGIKAIKALEQEPILDKITTEIMQLDYDLESVDFDYNDMPQTELVHMICREEVLQIIDKHKERSEV